jgi:hypothetical protein
MGFFFWRSIVRLIEVENLHLRYPADHELEEAFQRRVRHFIAQIGSCRDRGLHAGADDVAPACVNHLTIINPLLLGSTSG